jgi:hypothetical protein
VDFCRFGVDLEWVRSCFEPQGDVFWTLKSRQPKTPTNETFEWGVGGSSVSLVDFCGWVFCRLLSIWSRLEWIRGEFGRGRSSVDLSASVDFSRPVLHSSSQSDGSVKHRVCLT